MKNAPLTLLLCLLIACAARAELVVDVEPLSMEEFEKEVIAYKTNLTREQRALLIERLSKLPQESQSSLQTILKSLANNLSDLPLEDIITLMRQDKTNAVASALAKHGDPILSFVANLQLAKTGNVGAARALYEAIHSDKPTMLQKRMLKTSCSVLGIDAVSDTANEISDYLVRMSNHKPKWKSGDAAPPFDVTDTKGRRVCLEKLKGKVVVLHFWSSWCGPCLGEMESLNHQLREFSSQEVAVISVSIDHERAAFDKVMQEHRLPWHQVFDGLGWGGKIAKAYGVNHLPYHLVIDSEGKIRSSKIEDLPKILTRSKASKQ